MTTPEPDRPSLDPLQMLHERTGRLSDGLDQLKETLSMHTIAEEGKFDKIEQGLADVRVEVAKSRNTTVIAVAVVSAAWLIVSLVSLMLGREAPDMPSPKLVDGSALVGK